MGIAAVGNNLITYVINEMHFPLSRSANVVTNFVGTIFLLALLGGYLSDSYLGSFFTILIFGFIELSVSLILSSFPSSSSLYIYHVLHTYIHTYSMTLFFGLVVYIHTVIILLPEMILLILWTNCTYTEYTGDDFFSFSSSC